ncbi:MerR family transcriptional regulator [Nocardioides jejuensis]|uniref:MerR family transcriptional regulator n=1 Tax=Nocardioides jejuensis TaxID=2502782 RepID=A0A4V2NXQ4_9ACTN|nr:MerR family transcriptional regulator [Nocardioides jejuensis]TCJ22052.1 MerR family transcriptional regulator [Nocardioides jejuensis]
MRISQLSQAADLPVGTVKFYLRTGLLHAGRATSATQAIYDQSHLERLRLVRALLEIGKLSHAEIQRVLAALAAPQASPDAAPLDTIEMLSLATAEPADIDGARVDLSSARELVEQVGWSISEDSPHLDALAQALLALDGIGVAPSDERMRVYAEAASHVARNDVSTVIEADPHMRALVAAAGTALYDAFLAALRQLAIENQVTRQRTRVPGQRATTIPSA